MNRSSRSVSSPVFHWCRTVFFLIPAIGIYTIVLGTISVGSSIFGRHGRLAHACARTWSWLILATTGVNVRLSGLEHVELGKPYLFICNHQSIYDIPVVFWSLPFEVRIIAKESLGAFPFLGWHLRRTGHVLVNRDNPGAGVYRELAGLIERGHSLIVFPEGTRSADGRVSRFRAGIFRLAIEAGLSIVPMALSGSRHVMRKGRLTTRPGEVSLEVFSPISTSGYDRDRAKDLAADVQRIVEAALAGDEDETPDGARAQATMPPRPS